MELLYLCLDSTVNELCTSHNNNDYNNVFNIAIIMREDTPTKKARRLKDSMFPLLTQSCKILSTMVIM